MSPFPRSDYDVLTRYDPNRTPVDVDLSDNTNLWGTHPAALERIRAAGTDDLARYPQLYADVLRDAVSARFDVDAGCVATGAGSDDVLDSAFRAVYAPGGVVRFAAPTFSMVEPLARMNGMAAEPVAWQEALAEPGRMLAPSAATGARPDLVYVCRPNNPTGECAPREWVEEIIALNADDDALIIIDEAYADFAGETFVSEAARTPRVLVARTASKAYGLAGLRCGFAVASPETTLEIEKSRGPYKVARLAAEATAAAIRDEDGWMAGVVAECVETRTRFFDALQVRGLDPIPSCANFVLIKAPTGSALADALSFREMSIGVRPFTEIPGHGESLRVTVGPWPLMEQFLEALARLLGESPAKGASGGAQ
jgi:histidinol-phosphate aminotransferase